MSEWPVRAGRRDTRAERAADAVVQIAGLALGLAGVVVLALLALPESDGRTIAALAVYAAGLLGMLGCSAVYNLSRDGPRLALKQRLDRAAIFVMIAGTYTPLALVAIGGTWGWALFAAVWTGAAAGVTLKLFWPDRFERLAIAAYLLLGWVVLVALRPVIESLSPAGLILLAAGGVSYSLGVIFHLWRRLPGQNAIWHGFVLAGAGCHYAAIVIEVAARA